MRILAECPGGAIRRLYFDDGTTSQVWLILIETAKRIETNLTTISPLQKSVLERISQGPLDFDVKHWGTYETHFIQEIVGKWSLQNNFNTSSKSFILQDGRIVTRANLYVNTFSYSLDIGRHLSNESTDIKMDYRLGDQQSYQANVFKAYLLVDDSTQKIFVGYQPKKSIIRTSPYCTIVKPQYVTLFQALCAFARMIRIELLSETKEFIHDTDTPSKFCSQLSSLIKTYSVDNNMNDRLVEFIADMLVASTISLEQTILLMKYYGVMDVLYPSGLKSSARGRSCLANLEKFDPTNPFCVMRFVQDFDPSTIFTR